MRRDHVIRLDTPGARLEGCTIVGARVDVMHASAVVSRCIFLGGGRVYDQRKGVRGWLRTWREAMSR